MDIRPEDITCQRCNEHQAPDETAIAGRFAVVPSPPASTSAKASSPSGCLVGELDLDLTRFQLSDDALHGFRECKQDTSTVEDLSENLLNRLAHVLSIETQELASIGSRDIHRVKIWGQPR